MTTSIDYGALKHHPTSEKVVELLCDRIQINEPVYFRVLVAYFFAVAASSMRTNIVTPEGNKVPVNTFALNLAPSGFGKGRAVSLLEDEVLNQFQDRFLDETFPTLVEENLPKIANQRAVRKASDPDEELARVEKEFNSSGPFVFTFDSGTDAAVKQMRHKLLMAKAGSMNLQTDEIGSNLLKNKDMFDVFFELFDGKVKSKLTKNTSDNVRNEDIKGITPTNMLLFGAPVRLLNGAREEEELMAMLDQGYARRCFFGYIRSVRHQSANVTPEEALAKAEQSGCDQTLSDLSDHFDSLADIINANKTLVMPKETRLLMFQYKLDCSRRAADLRDHEESRRTELEARFFKALKLAGAYAFVDDSPEITPAHFEAAILLAEESGQALERLLKREKPYEKLARYIAELGEEVTHADLVEDLPFYPKAQNQRTDMLNLAIAWGYKKNIIIKKSFNDGIEFLRGESLKETNLDEMIVAYSDDMTEGYLNEHAPFDQLHKMTQAPGMHWVSHHLKGGYRKEENAIPGCNMVVIDCDGELQLDMARNLLADYKYLLYTTKRHTPDTNRFRIIFPSSHELKMDAKDFKEFYNNIRAWLPFDSDDSCAQRSKKWLTHPSHYEYNDGELLDVLPFIPKTSKNEERKKFLQDHQSLNNLERWVMANTGDGNRNNMLLRYAMILVDAGFDYNGVRSKVVDLNDKLADKLDEAEIMGTIMVSAGRAIAKQQP